jgi:pimeloyl-ACP methyl ester carboxylesterase
MAGGRLSFAEAGSGGHPMVFVHGWSCNRAHMRGLFEYFAASRRVLAPDLPGHGQTPLGDVPVIFAGFSRALAQFCAAHDLRNATLVGHSMGGVLAIHAAGLRPDRVARVVNLDGALPLRPEALAAYAQLFDAVRRDGFRAAVEPFVRNGFFLPEEAGPEADAIVAAMMSSPEAVAESLLGQFPKVDAAAALGACRMPVTVRRLLPPPLRRDSGRASASGHLDRACRGQRAFHPGLRAAPGRRDDRAVPRPVPPGRVRRETRRGFLERSLSVELPCPLTMPARR